jgi:hypothetical protein
MLSFKLYAQKSDGRINFLKTLEIKVEFCCSKISDKRISDFQTFFQRDNLIMSSLTRKIYFLLQWSQFIRSLYGICKMPLVLPYKKTQACHTLTAMIFFWFEWDCRSHLLISHFRILPILQLLMLLKYLLENHILFLIKYQLWFV